jgi:hypothetical protein
MRDANERYPLGARDANLLIESHLQMLEKMEDLADTAERISDKADRILGRKP